MKNYLSILLAIILLAEISCQPKVDVEKEKEAVLKVLQAAGDEFAKKNKDGIFNTHIQDESATRVGGSKVYTGWDEIKELYENYLARNQADTITQNPRNIKENIIVKVNGNNAWVVCDNIWKWELDGKEQGFQNKQIAVFEKQDEQWKFALNAFVEYQKPKIIGAWNLVSMKYVENGKVAYEYPSENVTGKDMKIWTGSHFSFNGKFKMSNETIENYGGGTYTLNGNIYEETVVYHGSKDLVGQTIKMLLEIKNDTLTQKWPVDADGNIDENNYYIEKYVRLD